MKQQLIIRDKSIDELKSTIRWLVDTLQDNQTLKTKDGKAYTTEMKVCVMELLDNNVSACRVGETIEMVLALANLMASDIPSNATVLNYNMETLILAHRQLGEDLPREKTSASSQTRPTSLETSTWGTMWQALMEI